MVSDLSALNALIAEQTAQAKARHARNVALFGWSKKPAAAAPNPPKTALSGPVPVVSERAADFIAAGDYAGLVADFKRRNGIKEKAKPKAKPAVEMPSRFAGLTPKIGSFSRIMDEMTGVVLEPEGFLKSKARRALLHEQTTFLASILERNGVSAYRKQGSFDVPISVVGLLTGAVKQLEGTRFRALNILPEPTQKARNERALYIEAFLHAHPHGKDARYCVQTLGQRVRVQDSFVVARRKAARRLISRELRPLLLQMFSVDLVFSGIEPPFALAGNGPDKGHVTVHDHFNFILVPSKSFVNWEAVEWCIIDFFSKKTLPGDLELIERHGENATIVRRELDARRRPITVMKRHGKVMPEPIQNTRELCKYVCKNEDLIALAEHSEADFMKYFNDLKAIKSFSTHGALKAFISDANKANCRPVLNENREAAIMQKTQLCGAEVRRALDDAEAKKDRRGLLYDAVNDCVMGRHDMTEQERRDADTRRERIRDGIVNRWCGTMLPCPMFFNVMEPVAIVQGYDASRANFDDEHDSGAQGLKGLQEHIEKTRTEAAEKLFEQGVVLPSVPEMQAMYDAGDVILGHVTNSQNDYVHNPQANCRLACQSAVSLGGVSGMATGPEPPKLPRYGLKQRPGTHENVTNRPIRKHRKRSRGGKRRREARAARNAAHTMPRRAVAAPQM